MTKIRLFFAGAIISLILLITSVAGIITCINYNAYDGSLNYCVNSFYSKTCEEIANNCADILDRNTSKRAFEQIKDEYEYSIYGIYVNSGMHVYKSDNYTGNVAYEKVYKYRIDFFMSNIYYLDENATNETLISVSIPYDHNHSYAQIWHNRYTFIAVAAITSQLFIGAMVFLLRFTKTTPLKTPKFLSKLPTWLYLIAGTGTTAIFSIFLFYSLHLIIAGTVTFTIKDLYSLLIILPIILLALTVTIFIIGIVKRVNEKRFFNELLINRIGQKYGVLTQAIVLSSVLLVLIIATILLSYFVWSFAWILLIAIITPLWIFHVRNIFKLVHLTDKYCNGDWSEYPTHQPVLLGGISGSFYKLSASMQATVEKSVRDERTKTELITNVSHDIKTPLTSIINYTELLKNENLSEEQRNEYLEVLSKNSARMKKLIEDLIEASKAATGNIELHPIECSIDTLLSQAIVEREPDAALRNLKFVFIKQRDPVIMTIDGEKLYRVFDNLLSNAIKYSLPGSRIYVDLSNDDMINIVFKNITEEQVTISPEELTERFVKGDISRHSEGSGLGLAICKSLVELMGGTIKLEIDGDQFIVRLAFPIE